MRSNRGFTRRDFGKAAGLGLGTVALAPSLPHPTAAQGQRSTRIDAHVHLWRPENPFHGFPPPNDDVLYRDILPGDAASEMSESRVDGLVVVEAAQNPAEIDWLLGLAEQHDTIKAVVGWLPLDDPAAVGLIDRYAANARFSGVRAKFNKHDVGWPLEDELAPALNRFAHHDLAVDLQINVRHWEMVDAFISKYPDLRFVINHGGKPVTRQGLNGDGGFKDWAPHVERWAVHDNVYMKLSGFFVGTAPPEFGYETFAPYVHHLWDVFAPDRLIYASNWPVIWHGDGSMAAWENMVSTLLDERRATQDERDAVMGGNAARAYRIG